MVDVARREFFDVIGSRRSVRYFEPSKPVEREKVQTILEAARIASHMGNANAVQAVVVTDQETKEKLKSVVSPFNAPMIDMAPVVIVFHLNRDAWYKEIGDHLVDLLNIGAVNPSHGWSVDNIQNSTGPRLISFPMEVVDFMLSCETGMAMAQAQLTAVALGLGVCAFAGIGPKVAEVMGFPPQCRFVWGLVIGYPAEDPKTGGQRPRKPFGDIFFENTYGNPFKRDESVVEDLKGLGLIQAEASLTPERKAEVNEVSRRMGLPERE